MKKHAESYLTSLNYKFLLTIALMGLLMLSACQKHTVSQPHPSRMGLNRILIVPFRDMIAVYGSNTSGKCSLCSAIFHTGETADGAAARMTKHLMTALGRRPAYRLIPPGQFTGVQSEILAAKTPGGTSGNVSDRFLYVKSGRTLNADAVIVGHLYRFKERKGTSYAADTPASVAFGLHLIRVKDGRVIKTGYFDETQQSLNENLFKLKTFLQRNGKWLTADELAAAGIEELLESY